MPNNRILIDAENPPWRTLGRWPEMFQELWESREMIHRLWYRDFVGPFRQSFLGLFWLILPPLAVAVIFTFLRSAHIVNVPMEQGALPYILFALVGSMLWQMFSAITLQVTESIVGSASLISKVYFPREVLAVSALGKALVATVMQFAALILTLAACRYWPPWQTVFLPLAVVPLAALSLGLGLLFAPIHSVVRDTSQILSVLFRLGMFLAPTVYPTPLLSVVHGGHASLTAQVIYWLHNLNPVSHFMTAVRDLLQYGNLTDPLSYWLASAFSLLILAVGWRFFDLCEPLMAERI